MKKLKILTLRKTKVFFVIILLMLVVSSYFIFTSIKKISISKRFTIVLDAGHGGIDGGSVGVNGTIEKEINLEYVFLLRDKLEARGYSVELTRKDDNGLYSSFATNKKRSDMKERLRIIKKANPNLVISLHMNSFTTSEAKGSFTYYRSGDEAGKNCADLIQKSLHEYCGARQKIAKTGDYYILNSNYYTAILIECGFLSNPEEERKLNDQIYKDQLTDAICNGILLYCGMGNV